MSVYALVIVGLVAALLATTLRQMRPEYGLMLSVAAGALILIGLLGPLEKVIDVLRDVALRANVDVYYVGLILKIVGVAYLAQFAGEVARDAGEGALASKIEFGGKVAILTLAVPVVLSVAETVIRLLALQGPGGGS